MMAKRPAYGALPVGMLPVGMLLVSALLVSACGSGGADGPGSVSVDEAQALDEAAEMLEERRLPEGALPETTPPLEEIPPKNAIPEDSGE